MDPYLERHWGDIHHSLVQYARDQLQEQLPDSLRARVEERIFLESEDGRTRSVFPDVRIVHRHNGTDDEVLTPATETGGVAVAEPLVLRLPNESTTEGFIEIRDAASGNRVVTVIEVLSAANKAGSNGTREYVSKQQEVLSGNTSLVEIDLLRRGRRITAVPWESVPLSHQTTYHVCVKRAWTEQEYEIYRVPLRAALPTINIPLRGSDTDVKLDLQSLIEQAYRTGRYDDIDYRQEPDPPLAPEDAKWADGLLRGEGRR